MQSMNILNRLIDIAVIVDGRRAPIYAHQGRYFVEGTPGAACVIEVRNTVAGRLEIVESIDGRDVLRDAAASLGSSGMIVPSYSTWKNSGWRLNDDKVATFLFSDTDQSIAAQVTGSTAQVGVIGIAVYEERQRFTLTSASSSFPPPYTGSTTFDSATAKGSGVYRASPTLTAAQHLAGTTVVSNFATTSDSLPSADMAPDLGMGIGAVKADHIGHTSFERATAAPALIVEIQYRSHAWLVANGVIGSSFPSAFSAGDTGYAQYVK